MDAYKVKQLKEMLAYEKDLVNGGYGAHLSYKGSEAAPYSIRCGGAGIAYCVLFALRLKQKKD